MRRNDGFTLVEVLLAVAITAMAMLAVTQAFVATMRSRAEVESLSDSTEVGLRVINLLERDLQGLWHHNVRDNKVLLGRDMQAGVTSADADRIDFLTSTDSINGSYDPYGNLKHPTVCEVGYWFKENRNSPGLLELWRREDGMVDDDLMTGGRFQLITDRLRSFNITYFETLGAEAEPLHEWDASREAKLPRRLKVEFTVERQAVNRNEVSHSEISELGGQQQKYVRHIVLDRRLTEIMQPGIAMVPIAPGRPEGGEGGPLGPAGPGGPAGPAGPGGPGGPPEGMSGRSTTQTTGGPPDGGRGKGPEGFGQGTFTQSGPGRGTPPGNTGAINLGDLLRGGRGGSGGAGLFGGLGGGR